MLTFLFFILFIMFFGRVLIFALRAAWGLLSILLTVVFFPLILLALVFSGLLVVAFPVLIISGIIWLVAAIAR